MALTAQFTSNTEITTFLEKWTTSASTSMPCVCIQGDEGCGKTSMLHYFKEYVAQITADTSAHAISTFFFDCRNAEIKMENIVHAIKHSKKNTEIIILADNIDYCGFSPIFFMLLTQEFSKVKICATTTIITPVIQAISIDVGINVKKIQMRSFDTWKKQMAKKYNIHLSDNVLNYIYTCTKGNGNNDDTLFKKIMLLDKNPKFLTIPKIQTLLYSHYAQYVEIIDNMQIYKANNVIDCATIIGKNMKIIQELYMQGHTTLDMCEMLQTICTFKDACYTTDCMLFVLKKYWKHVHTYATSPMILFCKIFEDMCNV